ncbi:MAG: hypothetical protein HOC91_17105 [Nitrospinaceae bacterium]|jgi:hypothetical protein|nr:hypothetical protein [Nitrospinaceae bacterium]MBT3434344.1 hypothetical protein [Nitrospinaceae bacterium]MBT3821700.1 hypothetical protein [Nitrospinaceae bacterium]MBT4093376.1 hypothetical protein [Nitrospinaceae bacterium]MBT4432230.1 hypothetical protein [Nitrospinaceae bacterium]
MLKPADFKELYREFESAPSVFDCGKKCSPFNDGEPFCCDSGWVVPIAFPEEWAYLEKKTNLWHEFRPRNSDEFDLMEEIDQEESVFIECRGVKFCERDNRSISCRTFPFEPYLDTKGNFIGIVYNRVMADKCYLVDRHSAVTKGFIKTFMRFFEKFFVMLPSERELYLEQSRIYRNQMSRKKLPLVVLTEKGPWEAAYRGGKLIAPWTKPDPPENSYCPDV